MNLCSIRIHKWRYDTPYDRTCIKCNSHQHFVAGEASGWLYITCEEYKQWVGWYKKDVEKEKRDRKKCKFHGKSKRVRRGKNE